MTFSAELAILETRIKALLVENARLKDAQGLPARVAAFNDLDATDLLRAITDYAIFRLTIDGNVVSWNEGAERIKGYRPDEILGSNFAMFFTPEDQTRGEPARALATARDTGRFASDGWRVRRDGTRFWASSVIDTVYDANGTIVGYAKVTRDTTAQHLLEEAIHQAERRFRFLMDSVIHYAIYTIDPDGLVTSWNVGAERAKGYKADEILGRSFARFYTSEDQASGAPARALAIAKAERRFQEDGWRVRQDGSRFWANVVIEPMVDELGQLIGFAKVTRDISEKLVLEEAREQLHQAQKMELVGQLTGGVAHDFNNLLTVVTGSLEMLSRQDQDDRARRMIETALRASHRGAKLTSQLLSFSRRQVLRPQTADVNDLINDFEDLLRQSVKESIDLRLDLGAEVWPIKLDHAHFQSALLNLVVNARDAMETGGTLTIETRNRSIDQHAASLLKDIAPGSYVEIVVRDTGAGMTAEVCARAIEPFYTTKSAGLGSGLGLSQVYGFVRQSDGQIKIDSVPGHGAAVSIYLPRSSCQAMVADAAVALTTEVGTGTILIVEDDPDVLDIAISAIESFGYNVHSVRTAAEAITFLQGDVHLDILFTDIVLGTKVSGVDLARSAVSLRPDLRVLLTSGYPRESLESTKVYGEHEMDFISKPYSLSVLSERLGIVCRSASLANLGRLTA